jgi:hypothetical protein
MAGYFLYTLDKDVFSQLTTAPTREQGLVLADYLREYLASSDDEPSAMWPGDREALAGLIVRRLALPDWYSDLSYEDAHVWDSVLLSLDGEPGEALGIGFQCSDYESIYWDCAEAAADRGATMVAEPAFGNSGFRYFGKPTSDYSNYPMYTLYTPDRARHLLAQLEEVEPHFRSLAGGEGSVREQFFEGLLPPVRGAVARGRVLWVQTDT